MKNAVPAALVLALGLLGGCATPTAKYAIPSGANPARNCQLMPVMRYMWGYAYRSMLDVTVQPEWVYPAYAGLGTLSWLVITPFFPVADVLTAPLWATQECAWDGAQNS